MLKRAMEPEGQLTDPLQLLLVKVKLVTPELTARQSSPLTMLLPWIMIPDDELTSNASVFFAGLLDVDTVLTWRLSRTVF